MSIAWTGRVMMDSAAWGDETGSTVTFKLPMNKEAQDQRNPFHQYTKRRKGRSGTRFMMACQTAGEGVRHALYEDEAMLAGWNDSQQKGHTVKLWLCNDKMGHPFEGVDRKTPLVVSLVELDDDNEVIDQKMRDRVERQQVRPSGRLSYVAAMLCKQKEFWDWCGSKDGTVKIGSEEGAKMWLYAMCGIDSRAQLDVPAQWEAIERFHEIRSAFAVTQEKLF